MLVFCEKIDPLGVELYHKEQYKQEKIRSRDGYQELRQDIQDHGIRDPILCIQFSNFIQIEIGEQRLMIARELGIGSMNGFIRADRWGIQLQDYTAIESMDAVHDYFECKKVETFVRIRKYILGGVIKL